MYKKVSTIIIIVLVILCLFLVYRNYSLKRNSVNLKNLSEDIESIIKDGTIKNAKLNTEEYIGSGHKYYGEGYLIEEVYGGEAIEYILYQNNEKVWNYLKVYPMTGK